MQYAIVRGKAVLRRRWCAVFRVCDPGGECLPDACLTCWAATEEEARERLLRQADRVFDNCDWVLKGMD